MGRHRLPIVNIRCEWCKRLFAWKFNADQVKRDGVRATCGNYCCSRLAEWKKNRSA